MEKSEECSDNRTLGARIFQIGVSRSSLCEDDEWNGVLVDLQSQTEDVLRTRVGLPLPRTSGTCALAQRALEMTGKGNPMELVLPDLNIVKVIEAATAEISPSSDGNSTDHALRELLVAIKGHGATVSAKFQEPFSRLMIGPGRSLAKERVNAVRDGLFYIYPSYSEHCADLWEVRWLDRGSKEEGRETSLKLERFHDWGFREYSHGIELCAALGHGKRLSPLTLAQEDPVAFWQSVFRHTKVFERLDQVCGAKEWDRLSLGARRVNAWMELPDSRLVGFPQVEKKIKKGGDKVREEIGEFGTISFSRLIEKAHEVMGPSETGERRTIALVMDEQDSSTRVSALLDSLLGRKSPFEPGDRVQIHGLVSASHHNFKFGKVLSQTEERAEVLLEGAGRTRLSVKFANLQFPPTGVPDMIGACKVCGGCGGIEEAPGSHLLCSGCRCVWYCQSKCQKRHWKMHKKVCGKPMGEREDDAVQCVMLRGDNRAYPHAIYALHGNDTNRAIDMLSHEYLGAELDNPARTVSPILVDVLRGDLAPQGCLYLLHMPREDAPGNMRASSLISNVEEWIPVDESNVPFKVRGDAILLQFKKSLFLGTPMGSNKLVDFGMELWDMHYGIFKFMSYGGRGMGTFWGKTPEGAVAEEEYSKLMAKEAEMRLLPVDDPRREELQKELNDMRREFVSYGEERQQKIAEKEAQGKKGLKILGLRHGVQ